MDGLNWYLVTAIAPDGKTEVSKFIVGYSRKSVMKRFKKKCKGTAWTPKNVHYLDSDVSELAAQYREQMWR